MAAAAADSAPFDFAAAVACANEATVTVESRAAAKSDLYEVMMCFDSSEIRFGSDSLERAQHLPSLRIQRRVYTRR